MSIEANDQATATGPCTYCGAISHWRPDCPELAREIERKREKDALYETHTRRYQDEIAARMREFRKLLDERTKLEGDLECEQQENERLRSELDEVKAELADVRRLLANRASYPRFFRIATLEATGWQWSLDTANLPMTFQSRDFAEKTCARLNTEWKRANPKCDFQVVEGPPFELAKLDSKPPRDTTCPYCDGSGEIKRRDDDGAFVDIVRCDPCRGTGEVPF